MKIEMKDLDEALSCNRALFSDGDELSENVVERICYSDEPERPSNKQLKQLTENMVRVGNVYPHLYTVLHCRHCGAEIPVTLSKTHIRTHRLPPAELVTFEEYDMCTGVMKDEYFRRTDNALTCQRCFDAGIAVLRAAMDEITADPVAWMNANWDFAAWKEEGIDWRRKLFAVNEREDKLWDFYYHPTGLHWQSPECQEEKRLQMERNKKLQEERESRYRNRTLVCEPSYAEKKKLVKVTTDALIDSTIDCFERLRNVCDLWKTFIQQYGSEDHSRTLNFGKYRGQPVMTVIMEDPRYIRWAVNNIREFELTDEERSALDGRS